jgi:non-specific serine/threonine protein kinase
MDSRPRGVSFGRYRFEPATGQLWSGEREVRLTPKAAAVLATLVERAGQPVSKGELFARVWPDAAVSDDALTSCIQELRRALDDDPREPRFIETRHRRGYRFAATVESAGAGGEDGGGAAPDAMRAIAVLPFADMSPDRNQGYLCEGLAEELINALTHVEGLRVAARVSSFQFRDRAVGARAIGRQLRVGTLLEGSVRKSGDRLRITVQLIETAAGYHRWSRRFDRTLDDVFAIQDEIAEAVATSLRGGVLSQRERDALHRPQTGAEPYEYYLRGRQRLHGLTRSELDQSREMFERAIALDAAYAPAWAGVATLHAILYEWWGASDEDLARADRASGRALTLAPRLADAHVARGFALSLRREYGLAERHFEQAIRINPNLFDAYYYAARSSFARGEVERSVDLFRRAAEVRQEDFQSPILLSQSLNMLGRAEEAMAANREGIARAERILALNPADERALSLGSSALFDLGEAARAVEWSRRALELYPDSMSALVNGACLCVRAGLKDEALDLLERVFAKGWGKRDWIEHDPDYDSLRGDPRFQQLLDKLK